MKIIPLNPDRNVTRKEYDQDGDTLLVYSMFETFQGEGPFAGVPAFFIRLAGCDIGAKEDCPWCDTQFAYERGEPVPVEALAGMVPPGTPLVVVTGGEPLLQAGPLGRFVHALGVKRPEAMVQLESNGHLFRPEMTHSAHGLSSTFLVISPKIPHTRPTYTPLPEWWWKLLDDRQLFLKYVVSADPESPYHSVPSEVCGASGAAKWNIFVSGMTAYKRPPQGEVASIWDTTLVDQEATAANYQHAATLAIKHGLRVSYQTHLFGVQP